MTQPNTPPLLRPFLRESVNFVCPRLVGVVLWALRAGTEEEREAERI